MSTRPEPVLHLSLIAQRISERTVPRNEWFAELRGMWYKDLSGRNDEWDSSSKAGELPAIWQVHNSINR
jgi:hypothetical protein